MAAATFVLAVTQRAAPFHFYLRHFHDQRRGGRRGGGARRGGSGGGGGGPVCACARRLRVRARGGGDVHVSARGGGGGGGGRCPSSGGRGRGICSGAALRDARPTGGGQCQNGRVGRVQRTCSAVPCRAVPYRAVPCRAVPCRVVSCCAPEVRSAIWRTVRERPKAIPQSASARLRRCIRGVHGDVATECPGVSASRVTGAVV